MIEESKYQPIDSTNSHSTDVRIVEDIAIRKEGGWSKARNIVTLLSAIFAATSLIFTFLNVNSARENQRKTAEYVDTLSSKIIQVTDKLEIVKSSLENLPTSISKIDTTVRIMEKEVGQFGEVVGTFKNSLSEFNKVADKQLALLKETQKQWEIELSKKADLKLAVEKILWNGDTLTIDFMVENYGNKGAEYVWINYYVPIEYKFSAKSWRANGNEMGFTRWGYGPIQYVFAGIKSSPHDYSDNFTKFSLYFEKEIPKSILLPYTISCKESEFINFLELNLPPK